MHRKLVLTAAALLVAAGCGGSSEEAATVQPAHPPEFWSQPAHTEQQRQEVASGARQIDVCALLPRDVLADLGEVRRVTTDLYSCTAEVEREEQADVVIAYWSPTLLAELTGATKPIGDVSVRVVPDRETGPATACGTTSRFPAGAAIYLGVTANDPCALAERLTPGMLDRWRAGPVQGTSPDTVRTVLLGADPCAVRARLSGTADTGEPRLTACRFRYRDEVVTVGYEYRIPDYLAEQGTEVRIDGRPVRRSVSVYDNTIPIFTAQVGPELPSGSTAHGPRVPVVEVTSASDEVAAEVAAQVLALFPER
ncbi:peptidase [Nocardia sp. NPDC004654]|uniref:peptidase n=1 Tax=Nocardia sp. NPDC004654 TaxID=3154776 RepID=UPI0033A1F9A8